MLLHIQRGLRKGSRDLWKPPDHGGTQRQRDSMREEPHCSTDEREWDKGKNEAQIQSDDEIPP